jgi:hypothetical protein
MIDTREARAGIAERLLDERQVLGVHVLVQGRQRVEVRLRGRRLPRLQPADRAPEDLADVVARRRAGGVGMVPATRVGHVERVVDAIRSRQEAGGAVEVAEDPGLLEPADVAHFPDRRLDEMPPYAQHLGLAEAVQQLQLDPARVEQGREEGVTRRPAAELGRLRHRGRWLHRQSPGVVVDPGCPARLPAASRAASTRPIVQVCQGRGERRASRAVTPVDAIRRPAMILTAPGE